MRHLLLAITLAACAPGSGQAPATTNASASGKGTNGNLICKEEAPTGSSISRQVCRTPDQIDDDRKDADAMFRNTPGRPNSTGPRGGNN